MTCSLYLHLSEPMDRHSGYSRHDDPGVLIGPVEGVDMMGTDLTLVIAGEPLVDLSTDDGSIALLGKDWTRWTVVHTGTTGLDELKHMATVLDAQNSLMDRIVEEPGMDLRQLDFIETFEQPYTDNRLDVRINKWASGLLELAVYAWEGEPRPTSDGPTGGWQLQAAWDKKTGRRLT